MKIKGISIWIWLLGLVVLAGVLISLRDIRSGSKETKVVTYSMKQMEAAAAESVDTARKWLQEFHWKHECESDLGATKAVGEAAAVGAARKALAEIDARTRELATGAHVIACETIMRHSVLARVNLAKTALNAWEGDVSVTDVFQTQTHTGVLHLRVKMEINAGRHDHAFIEFIGSPKSNVIASEGSKGLSKRRWPKIAMTAEAISGHVDRVLEDFLSWHP